MSTFRNPVGPQPSSVYWRRRLVVGLGLLAAILVVVLIFVRPDPGTVSTPDASTTPTDTPTNVVATDVAECLPANVQVVAVTDSDRYDDGRFPLISLTVTNSGSASCLMAVGTDVQVYTITSGSDQIWTSTDCQQSPEPLDYVLEPGVTLSTTPIPWERTRSSSSTCDSDRPAVAADGASYHLSVSVGGVQSAQTKQFLLF